MKKARRNTHIPQDIIFKILLHLPTKTVIKCKTICKLWYRIIDDPDFAYMHSIYKPHADVYILQCCRVFTQPLKPLNFGFLPLLAQDEFSNHQGRNDVWTKSQMPKSWFSSYESPVVASCSGLICLTKYQGKFQVLNPLCSKTDTYEVNLPCRSCSYVGFGFGFDESSHRFKIVYVGCSSGEGEGYYISLFVHELGSNTSSSWRQLSQSLGCLNISFDNKNSVFLDGSIYWLASLRNIDGKINIGSIVSFNLTSEALEFELLPAKVFRPKLFGRNNTYLVDIDGSLGLVMTPDCEDKGNIRYRVFCPDVVNNNEGNINGTKKKWIMKFCIKLPLGHSYEHVGFLRDCHILIKNEKGHYFSYNLQTGNTIHLSGLSNNIVFMCHQGSLIRPSILDAFTL